MTLKPVNGENFSSNVLKASHFELILPSTTKVNYYEESLSRIFLTSQNPYTRRRSKTLRIPHILTDVIELVQDY